MKAKKLYHNKQKQVFCEFATWVESGYQFSSLQPSHKRKDIFYFLLNNFNFNNISIDPAPSLFSIFDIFLQLKTARCFVGKEVSVNLSL